MTLEQVLTAYKAYRHQPRGKYLVPVMEDAALLLAWAGRRERAAGLLRDDVEEMKGWPPHVMARLGGVSAWFEKMIERVHDPAAIHATAQAQARALKVEKLPTATLIA